MRSRSSQAVDKKKRASKRLFLRTSDCDTTHEKHCKPPGLTNRGLNSHRIDKLRIPVKTPFGNSVGEVARITEKLFGVGDSRSRMQTVRINFLRRAPVLVPERIGRR